MGKPMIVYTLKNESNDQLSTIILSTEILKAHLHYCTIHALHQSASNYSYFQIILSFTPFTQLRKLHNELYSTVIWMNV